MATTGNPWKGLKSYSEGEILYGRNEDILALSQYIINNTQTVLYGKSGIGKSSILNAGVFPVARQNGLFPIPIRLEHNSTLSYVQQFAAAIAASGLVAHEVVPVIDKTQESLWEFIHRQYFTLKNDDTPVQPLFVIDQFEEIFSLQNNEKKKLIFFSQLADLLNDVCPMYIHEKINDGIVDEASTSKVDLNEVVSLNSFTFNLGDEISSSENLPEYLDCPSYHIVFAMREDFLSYLERYTSYIPVMKNNRFGLKPLNEEQAAEIIMRPCPGLVDIDVAVHIIEKVTGRNDFILDGIPEIEVDSAVLSLYLSRLYEKKASHAGKLTNELIDEFGDNIIVDFYLESIADLSPETVENLEYQLLTSDGRRDNVSRSDLESSGVSAEQIDTLINDKKILRQFSYGNDIRIEYIHDILCPVITKLKEEKELEKLKQQQKSAEELRHKQNRLRNQQRVQSDLNVLTVRGRKPLDNTVDFGAFENKRYLDHSGCAADHFLGQYLSTLDYTFRYIHHDEINVSSIGRLIDIGKGNIYTTCIEFKDSENRYIRTLDGISKMNVTFDGDLIKQVDFIKVEKDYQGLIQEKPFYINGFCAIELAYNDDGREIKRVYLDENHHPVPIYGGYSIIERHYDAKGNLAEVKYFDVDNKPTCHWNGNHGYSSQFNEDGLEIRRIFFDTDMNTAKVTSGVCGRAFEHDTEGRIAYEWNLNENQCIAPDNKGYIGIAFEYDELSRSVKETFLDEKREPMNTEAGYAIAQTSYGKNSLIDKYYDVKGNAVTDSDGNRDLYTQFDDRLNVTLVKANSSKEQDFNEVHYIWDADGLLQNVQFYNSNGLSSRALWLQYDERNLFIQSMGFLDNKGQKEEYGNGAFGKFFERDEHGIVCAIWNLNRYNQPEPSTDGVIVRRIELDKGNIVKELYFDINNNPCSDLLGAYGYVKEYDSGDHETASICLDEFGNPGQNNEGIQIIRMQYNENGDMTERRYYDAHDNPCADENGDYGTRYEYNINQRMQRTICIDENGNPHNNNKGICYDDTYSDEQNRDILYCGLNVDGQPVAFGDSNCHAIKTTYNDDENSKIESFIGVNGDLVNNTDGVASTYSRYDKLGRLIQQKRYDKDGKLICDNDGDYGNAYEYSEDGREISIISLDANGEIHINNDGYAILRKVFDEQGREIEAYYFDAERKPTLYQDYYGFKTIYTGQDNKFIYMVLDSKGKPLFSASNGYYAIEKEKDNQGRLIHERYLDVNLQPMSVSDGSYGAHWTYDDEDNAIEFSRLDIDGNVMEMANGVAYEFRMNDDEGRRIYTCNYDINHHMVPDSIGVYGTIFNYLDDGAQFIKYQDQEQNPMLSNQGYGAIYRIFDNQGRQTFEMWLDLDGKPSPDEAGVSGWSQDFLGDGHILITNLDAERHPISNEDGEISILITLDDLGREISKLCLDVDLNPCPCNDGWIRRDKEYDEKGEEICNRFYDADGNPMPDKDGDYGYKLLPVKQPNEEWLAYLGKDGKPHLNQEGFASCYCVRDESGRIIKNIDYDKHGAPIKDNLGTYGREYEFQENGTQLLYFLNEDGERTISDEGVAFVKSMVDEQGRTTLRIYFDENGNPLPNDDGDYGFIRIYDDESRSDKTIGLGIDGEPHNNKQGYSSHVIELDEQGRVIFDYKKTVDGILYIDKEGWCILKIQYDDETPGHYYGMNLDEKGNMLPLKDRRTYTELFEDELGRTTKQLWFDENGDLCPDKDGYCGIQNYYSTDENGEVVCRFAYFNSQEEIITDEHGRTYFKETIINKKERRKQQLWFNSNMEPICTMIGNYGAIIEYIDDDLSITHSIISLGKDYTPHNNNKGFSKELLVYDNTGDVRSLYFDLDGNFVDVDLDD